jgi:hypothetical protein
MSTQKNISRKVLASAAIIIIATVAIAAVIVTYYWPSPQTQPTGGNGATGEPNLVSTNFQYTDNRTNPAAPFLRVTGTVTNNGNAKANNCFVHVNAIRSGNETVIDTTQGFKSLEPGESTQIDMMFPYTGDALVAYNAVLEWTN